MVDVNISQQCFSPYCDSKQMLISKRCFLHANPACCHLPMPPRIAFLGVVRGQVRPHLEGTWPSNRCMRGSGVIWALLMQIKEESEKQQRWTNVCSGSKAVIRRGRLWSASVRCACGGDAVVDCTQGHWGQERGGTHCSSNYCSHQNLWLQSWDIHDSDWIS